MRKLSILYLYNMRDLIIFLCPSIKKMKKITVLSSELKDCSGAYRGIRKRFILFTILLNVYLERIFQKSIRDMRKGVYVCMYSNLKDSFRPKKMDLNRKHFRAITFYNF